MWAEAVLQIGLCLRDCLLSRPLHVQVLLVTGIFLRLNVGDTNLAAAAGLSPHTYIAPHPKMHDILNKIQPPCISS